MKHVTVVGAICCYFYPAATCQYHSSLSRSTTERRPLVDHTLRAIDPPSQAWYNTEVPRDNGPSPSGKAPGFGPGIRGFESLRPSHIAHVSTHLFGGLFLYKRKPNKSETSLLYLLTAYEEGEQPLTK